jgi:AMP-polyphosphate phosphotransferase
MAARPRSAAPEERAFPFEVFPAGTLSLDAVDLTRQVEPEVYDRESIALQQQVQALQIQNFVEKGRVILVFEGWDAAGKGGAIRRLTSLMDPRGYRVWPIAAPNEIEREQHWLWRFWTRMPARGEIAVFDRSWYGRVLVERIEKLAKKPEWRRAYDEINAFERLLTQDGIRLLKVFLHIDLKTQLKRFKAREKDPVKSYKLEPDDWRNRKRAEDYAAAYQDMLDRTHRPDAPWRVIPANDKRYARLEVLRAAIRLLEGKTP